MEHFQAGQSREGLLGDVGDLAGVEVEALHPPTAQKALGIHGAEVVAVKSTERGGDTQTKK